MTSEDTVAEVSLQVFGATGAANAHARHAELSRMRQIMYMKVCHKQRARFYEQ